MSICRMGESGLDPGWRMRSVRLSPRTGNRVFPRPGPYFSVYMESYCISVVCKL